MDNIIILAGDSEADDMLATSLRMLFPECEIQVLSRQKENIKEVPVPAEAAHGDNRGRKKGILKATDYVLEGEPIKQ